MMRSGPHSRRPFLGILVWFAAILTPGFAPAQTPALLKDIAPGSGNSLPARFVDVCGTNFFTAASTGYGHALWKTDGTTGGTVLVKDMYPGSGGGVQPRELTALDALLVCIGENGVNGGELWRSDGTTAGSAMIRDINPGNQGQPIYMDPPTGLFAFQHRVYFSVRDGIHGRELWSTDGTAQGTVLIKDICPGGNTSDSLPTFFTPVGDILFFFAFEPTHGWEIWKTDGTTAGTNLVKDVWPGFEPTLMTHNNYQFNVGVLGQELFFAAPDGTHGNELWKSDGTTVGTTLVKDITPGAADSYLERNFTAAGPYLFFTADDGTHGRELWRTDGTAQGTVLVMDINPGSANSSPGEMVALGHQVVFGADDGVHGNELWISDGTLGGTRMLHDIFPGSSGSLRYYKMFAIGSRFAYFPADDGRHGSELWRTDGTAAGTTLVHDIETGYNGTYPEFLTLSSGRLIFRATDSAHGQEPRVLFPGATAQVRGEAHSLAGHHPTLRADDPVLGQAFTVRGRAVRTGDPIALVVGFPGSPLALPNGVFVYLDVSQPFQLLKEIRPAALDWNTLFFLPNLPGLTGFTFGLQAFQALPGTTLGFDGTNGLVMTIGL